ncbi:tyrosine-type recombinase/integrase [Paenirhodobacter populi]|uniref:tyrosine-type recombinase/integrase n=1 Tax=Paenirhodobacter populi TaxID=2306993 RepID=UPI000FE3460C|nr:site-specific integrase [Sinirhodobacter populi]RWR09822.1 site-specific integrase [Sinirhodobacter populi]
MASIRKLDTGKYRAEIARQGKRLSKVFPTQKAAKEWASRQEYLILNADEVKSSETFGKVMTRYARERSVHKRGERWEAIRLEKIGRDPIAQKAIGELTASDFAEWRDKRLTEVAPASVIREMQLMSSVLNVAVKEWRLISANPISDISRPKKPVSRDRLPTDDELKRLAHSAGSDLTHATARAYHAFRFALETAMRAGEIAGLTRDRIDMENRVARLEHTKNGRPRDVPLSSEAVRLLKELPAADPVFGLSSRQLDVLWRKLRDRAKVDGLTFHDSRHAAITRLAKKLDVLALARMVGHTDLRMLMCYYNETAAELAKRLD